MAHEAGGALEIVAEILMPESSGWGVSSALFSFFNNILNLDDGDSPPEPADGVCVRKRAEPRAQLARLAGLHDRQYDAAGAQDDLQHAVQIHPVSNREYHSHRQFFSCHRREPRQEGLARRRDVGRVDARLRFEVHRSEDEGGYYDECSSRDDRAPRGNVVCVVGSEGGDVSGFPWRVDHAPRAGYF